MGWRRYAHNSRLLVKAGDRVTAGMVEAANRSTGPHVHLKYGSTVVLTILDYPLRTVVGQGM